MAPKRKLDSDLPSIHKDIGSFFGATSTIPRQQNIKSYLHQSAAITPTPRVQVDGMAEDEDNDLGPDDPSSTSTTPFDESLPQPSSRRSRAPSPPPESDKDLKPPLTNLLQSAIQLANTHHSKYDPSHDFYHVERVCSLALKIGTDVKGKGSDVDLLVVELAALFHDLLDGKYLPPDLINITASEHLKPFWDSFPDLSLVSQEQRTLVGRVIENVSYSKEVKRLNEGKPTEWHETCLELHCVQDADKLDAIGAIGILRCAAYSAVTSRPLFLPPLPSSSTTTTNSNSSAIDHFREKLIKLEGMMRTDLGKNLAKRRTQFLNQFLEEIEEEGRECF